MSRLTTAVAACLTLAAVCTAQDEKPVALHPSTMRKGQIGKLADPKSGKPLTLEVAQVVSDDLLIVECRPGRKRVMLKFVGHKLAEGSEITDLKTISPSELFAVSGPMRYQGSTMWFVQPHAGK
jgi:hypothetical protein